MQAKVAHRSLGEGEPAQRVMPSVGKPTPVRVERLHPCFPAASSISPRDSVPVSSNRIAASSAAGLKRM